MHNLTPPPPPPHKLNRSRFAIFINLEQVMIMESYEN